MTDYIPSARNHVANPSFENDLTGWEYASMTVVSSADYAFAGAKSAKMTISSIAATPFIYFGDDAPYRIPIQPDQTAAFAARLMAVQANRQVNMYITFLDSSGVFVSSHHAPARIVPQITEGREWAVYKTELILAPANAAYVFPNIRFWNTNGEVAGGLSVQVGDVIYLDGVESRISAPLDSYIDGDQGSAYYWTGTAHLSTSVRRREKAIEAGFRGGATKFLPRFYKVTKTNEFIEDITDRVISATTEVDMDRVIKRTATLDTDQPGLLLPYKEFIGVHLRTEREDGTVKDEQVGVFSYTPPVENSGSGQYFATYKGFENTKILDEAAYRSTYKIAAGTNLKTAAEAIIDSEGLTHNLPSTSLTVKTGGMSFRSGTTKLQVVNALLQAYGAYPAWCDGTGRVTSLRVSSIAVREPFRVYTLGDDSELVGDIGINPNDDRVKNVVIVLKDDSALSKIRASATNSDPDSPVSTVSLGRDRVMKVVDANLASTEAAQLLANRLLEERGMHITAVVNALPDPGFSPHRTVRLDFSNYRHLADNDGKYYVKSFSFGMTPGQELMTLTLWRANTYGYSYGWT